MATAFWRAVQGRFVPPVTVDTLPTALLDRFRGPDERTRLLQLLQFVGPLTTPSLSLSASLAMAVPDPQKMQLVTPPPRS